MLGKSGLGLHSVFPDGASMENFSVPGSKTCPLAKLGRFKSTADNFLVYIVTISLASGPIRSLTSWYAKVLYGASYDISKGWLNPKAQPKLDQNQIALGIFKESIL